MKLLIKKGERQGEIIKVIDFPTVIGRGDNCTQQFTDPSISRKHFSITSSEEGYKLESFNTTNGTYLNEKKLSGVALLQDHDFIEAGNLVFEVILDYKTTHKSDALIGRFAGMEEKTSTDKENKRSKLKTKSLFSQQKEAIVHTRQFDPEITSILYPSQKVLQHGYRAWKGIYEILQICNIGMGKEELLDNILNTLFKTVVANRGAIIIERERNNKTERKTICVGKGGKRTSFSLSNTVLDEVIQKGVSVILYNPNEDEKYRYSESLRIGGINSIICAPLISNGRVLGAIYLDRIHTQSSPFKEEDLELLGAVGLQIGTALEKSLLFQQLQEDIEVRKQAERRFRLLAENSSDIISRHSPDGAFLYVSPASLMILGYAPDELLQKDYQKFVHLDSLENFEQSYNAILNSEDTIGTIVYKASRKDGTSLWLETNIRIIRDDSGQVIEFHASSRDITARKRASEALHKTNCELENALKELEQAQQQIIQQERLRALGQMASGIAHDFNNALAAVSGFSELLLMRPDYLDDKNKIIRYLKLINTAAQDGADVVGRLREFYRHREEDEVFSPINLNQLVEELIPMTRPKWKDQAQANNINIQIEKNLQSNANILGNRASLRQAFTNLIFNAVDAMPDGGNISFVTYEKESTICLEIQDTGTGMTEEIRQRCLEPFFSTKHERGTGLGLSMVYGIIKRHEGDISIRSELGKGTAFIVSLPIKTAKHLEEAKASSYIKTKAMKILVVDDEPMVREVVKEYLLNDGHSVVSISNGIEALEKYREESFDLVLTDKAMPGMSGDKLASAIKQFNPEQPIILLTGFGDMMKAAGEKPEGIDFILSKPVNLTKLREALARVCH